MQVLLDDDDLTARGVRPKSKTQRWRLIKADKFPKPVRQGNRNTWLESEIDKYLADLIAARDAALNASPKICRTPNLHHRIAAASTVENNYEP